MAGYLYTAAAATLWGLSGALAKLLFSGSVTPSTLLAVRLTGSFTLLLAIMAAARPRLVAPPRPYWAALAVFGGIMAAVQYTYYLTIHLTNVATAVFLQYLAPVLVAAWAAAAERRALGAAHLAALGLSVLGSLALVGGGGRLAAGPAGVMTGLASAFCWGLYAVWSSRRLAGLDSWTALLWGLGGGAALASLAVPPWRAWAGPHPPQTWALFAFVVVLSTLVPLGLYQRGLVLLNPERATLVATLEPAVAALAAYAIVGESLNAVQVAGAAAILAAVVTVRQGDAPGRGKLSGPHLEQARVEQARQG